MNVVNRGVSVQVSEFAQYIQFLQRNGYDAISCSDLLEIRDATRPTPKKPVVLTFDDGYDSVYENAYPLLSKLNWRCTIFLVCNLVGKQAMWEGAPPGGLLGWERIHELQSYGIEFGSHTLSHPSLTKIDMGAARSEIVDSKAFLEDRLGREVASFAYPYGHHSPALRDIVAEAGYKLAVTTQHGRVRPGDDYLLLPRVSVYHVPPISLKFGPRMANFKWRVETRKDTRPE
jgi:peptidoglycan/xylan/chitin deacetylase (PgdA/CDA1 family)